jgi:glycosyltransferase involved in cell wall biosynthesis
MRKEAFPDGLTPFENMFGEKIHLISLMEDVAGGNEWETTALFDLLEGRANVQIWSQCAPHTAFAERYPIKRLAPRRLRFPWRGTFVFNGLFFEYGAWLHLALPRRVVVICNTYDEESFSLPDRLDEIARSKSNPRVDFVFVSEMLKRKVGRPGLVQPSPVDLDRFAPATGDEAAPGRAFTIGRLSRDVPCKHHRPDRALYRRLAQAGCRIKIMGGTCLRPDVNGASERLELLPVGTEDAAAFLQRLDCFYYRTGADWLEPFGRVVAEAMACGLPVVCHDRGGYTELIEHGRNGFLFDTRDEAAELLMRLRRNPGLRASMGAAARQTVEAVYSRERRERLAAFYTS